jgi:serine/threonine protein kinase
VTRSPDRSALRRNLKKIMLARDRNPTADRHAVSEYGSDPVRHNTFRNGERVSDRYRIVRFVARGGMGEVYEAHDELLNERLALKTLLRGAEPEGARCLTREVQLARRISHPSVCRVHDAGVHRTGSCLRPVHYLTMEFVNGQSLGARIRQEAPLSPRDASSIALRVLGGLCAVHATGVVHRDLKSDNIMLRQRTSGCWEAVIMDFGLARALDENGQAEVTGSASILGTLSYMAPEQLLGGAESPKTDLFAFGVVFYEMLTGILPFGGSHTLPSAIERLTARALPPSTFCPPICRELDEFILGCLQRQPSERHVDSRRALERLQSVLGREADSEVQRCLETFRSQRLQPVRRPSA